MEDQNRRWDDERSHNPDGSSTALTVREMVLQHERRINAHDQLISEVKGAMKLIKIVLGVSVASALGTVIMLIELFRTHQL